MCDKCVIAGLRAELGKKEEQRAQACEDYHTIRHELGQVKRERDELSLAFKGANFRTELILEIEDKLDTLKRALKLACEDTNKRL